MVPSATPASCGDLRDLGVVEALGGEHLDRGVEDALALALVYVGRTRRRSRRSRARLCGVPIAMNDRSFGQSCSITSLRRAVKAP